MKYSTSVNQLKKLSYFYLSNGYEVKRMKKEYKKENTIQKIERWEYEESQTYYLEERHKK